MGIDKKHLLIAKKAGGILLWLIIWQAAAMLINKRIILVSPIDTVKRLSELVFEPAFLLTVTNSFLRISGGFLGAFLTGMILGALSYRFSAARAVISPLMRAVKAVPVASFIIFALFWIKSPWLSVLISFLTVLPVIYEAVCKGAENADKRLLEMARVFRFNKARTIQTVFLPAIMPFLTAACKAGAALAFKSGTAAEVIGQPDFTLGDMLYRAKIYLETADLFAWTLVIILLSAAFERLFLLLLGKAYNALIRIR